MMARFAFEELGARKAAVLADKSNSYSISQAEHFAEYFKRRGGEVTDFVEYAAGTVDYRAHLTQIKAGSPEVIFLPQYAQPGGMQVKQAKELGIEATFLGSNSLSDPPFVAAAGGAENVAGLYFLFNVNWSEPKFEAFINNYEPKYGEKPVTYHSLFGYDDVTLICEAIKNAGAAEPEAIRTAIEGLTDVPIMLGDGKFTMDAETHRTRNMPSWIMQWNEAGGDCSCTAGISSRRLRLKWIVEFLGPVNPAPDKGRECTYVCSQQLVNGISLGSMYALLAVGFAIVYNILGIVNFSHGATIALGAYCAYWLSTYLRLPWSCLWCCL